MNILMPVTLAAASLVLGTQSTSEGSCLLFFILQGQVDSAVLQAEIHVKGKKLGEHEGVSDILQCMRAELDHALGRDEMGAGHCHGLCVLGGMLQH